MAKKSKLWDLLSTDDIGGLLNDEEEVGFKTKKDKFAKGLKKPKVEPDDEYNLDDTYEEEEEKDIEYTIDDKIAEALDFLDENEKEQVYKFIIGLVKGREKQTEEEEKDVEKSEENEEDLMEG